MDKLHNLFHDESEDAFAQSYLNSLTPQARTEVVEYWFHRPKPPSTFRLFSYFILGSGAAYVVTEAIARLIFAAKSTPAAPVLQQPFALVSALTPTPDPTPTPSDATPPADSSVVAKDAETALKDLAEAAKAAAAVSALAG